MSSLLESIITGRGRGTVSDDPSTAGVEIQTHQLGDDVECKTYDFGGLARIYVYTHKSGRIVRLALDNVAKLVRLDLYPHRARVIGHPDSGSGR